MLLLQHCTEKINKKTMQLLCFLLIFLKECSCNPRPFGCGVKALQEFELVTFQSINNLFTLPKTLTGGRQRIDLSVSQSAAPPPCLPTSYQSRLELESKF